MFFHSVYFWLKPDTSDNRKKEFEQGLQQLTELEYVNSANWGPVARTALRPVVDDTYSYTLNIEFVNAAKHDEYQDSDAHHNFEHKFQDIWAKTKVYDSTTS